MLAEIGAISDSANKLLDKYMIPAMRNKKWRIREQTILLFHAIVSNCGCVCMHVGMHLWFIFVFQKSNMYTIHTV